VPQQSRAAWFSPGQCELAHVGRLGCAKLIDQ
jgi:hypothetical protein